MDEGSKIHAEDFDVLCDKWNRRSIMYYQEYIL